MTLQKIKIHDNAELRNELDALYETTNQVILAQWASLLAKHILDFAGIDYSTNDVILNSFTISQEWQNGQASVHDVRQSGFRVHQIARQTEDIVERTVYRVVGQSIAVGHMPGHAMVASDYAVKVVNLLFPDDEGAVAAERRWQINTLNQIRLSHCPSSVGGNTWTSIALPKALKQSFTRACAHQLLLASQSGSKAPASAMYNVVGVRLREQDRGYVRERHHPS